jgi:hypothetical protein
MAFKIRRGTDAQRLLITPAQGELIYTTDTKQLYVGDGSTAGGIAVDTGGAVTFTSIASDVTPDADSTRDIGSSGNRWADGWFDNVYGAFSGALTGNVTGTLTGNVTGDVTGNVQGDLVGSVFADDSTTVIDSVNKKIFGSIYSNINGNLYLSTNPSNNYLTNGDIVFQDNVVSLLNSLDTVQFGTNDAALGVSITIKSSDITNKAITVDSLTDGSSSNSFELQTSRGTLGVPLTLTQGDPIFTLVNRGYNGASYQFSSALFAQIDTDVSHPVSGSAMPGMIGFATSNNNGGAFNTLIFDSFGRLGVNTSTPTATLTVAGDASFTGPVKLAVYADDAARSTAITSPAKGMVVFMTSGTAPSVTNKTVVYDGGAWVALH